MKFLLDQNLSFRLVAMLQETALEITHVKYHGLVDVDDEKIWEFAKQNGFTIVTKDDDFVDRSLLHGSPPKIIHIRTGNGPTRDLAALISEKLDAVRAFVSHPRQHLFQLP